MRVHIRSDWCIALRIIALHEYYRLQTEFGRGVGMSDEEFIVTTADMLEIVAGGGNGVELVNITALLEQAAKELREKDEDIAEWEEAHKGRCKDWLYWKDQDARLREENARLQGLLREAHAKMEHNNLWRNLRHREAVSFQKSWIKAEKEITRLQGETARLREVLKEASVCLRGNRTGEDSLFAVRAERAAIREGETK